MTCKTLDPRYAKYDTTLYVSKNGLLEQVVLARRGKNITAGGIPLEFDNERWHFYVAGAATVAHFRQGCKEPLTNNLPVLHGATLVDEETNTSIAVQFNFEPMPNKKVELASRPGTLLERANGNTDEEAARQLFVRLLRNKVPIFWWTRNNILETLALHPTFRGSSTMAGVMAGICDDSNGTMREYAVLQIERREGYGSLRSFSNLLIELCEVQGEPMAFVVDCGGSMWRAPRQPLEILEENFGVLPEEGIPNPYDPKPGDVWVFQSGVRCVVTACDDGIIKCWVGDKLVLRTQEVFAGWLHANQPQERHRILLTKP